MNSDGYVDVFSEHVLPLSHQLGDPSADWIYMDDNATCHRSLAMLSKLRRASKFCGSQLVLLISTLLKTSWTC